MFDCFHVSLKICCRICQHLYNYGQNQGFGQKKHGQKVHSITIKCHKSGQMQIYHYKAASWLPLGSQIVLCSFRSVRPSSNNLNMAKCLGKKYLNPWKSTEMYNFCHVLTLVYGSFSCLLCLWMVFRLLVFLLNLAMTFTCANILFMVT